MPAAPMLTDEQRRFLDESRVARLATVDAAGQPHVVPICHAIVDTALCFSIDEKPKRQRRELKRLANLRATPRAAVVVDRYDEDWSRLGWVMVQGAAEIFADGAFHDRVQQTLRARYPQLEPMRIGHLPVVAVSIDKVTSWGTLAP